MRLRDIALAVLVTLIWGFNFVVIDAGLADFPPLLFSALRFTVAAVPAVFFLRRGDIPWKAIVSVGVVLGVVKYSLLYVGIDLGMPPGMASLVIQAQALFTMVFAAVVLKDNPNTRQRIGIGVGLAGLSLIAVTALSPTKVTGFVLVVGAAAAWGVANILIKRAHVDNFRLMVWMSTVPPSGDWARWSTPGWSRRCSRSVPGDTCSAGTPRIRWHRSPCWYRCSAWRPRRCCSASG
jgi:O-acetylserine/cysteine efflux transporter